MAYLSFADLIQLGDTAIMLFDRDSADLTKFGVSVTERTAIKTKTDALRHFKTDEEILGLQTLATATKDEARTKVLKGISDIMLRAKLVFSTGSPVYNSFSTKEMHTEDDANVVRIAYRVHRLATDYLPQLSARGLAQTELDDLLVHITSFDNAIDSKENAVRDRNTATQTRNQLSDELIKLISELFAIGKQVYEGVDASKYNDYIMYNV